METCQKLTADKGYDDVKFITKLWDKYEIKPADVIPNGVNRLSTPVPMHKEGLSLLLVSFD